MMNPLKFLLVLPIFIMASSALAQVDLYNDNETWDEDPTTASLPFAEEPQFVENEVIVKFKTEGIQSLDEEMISIRDSLGVLTVEDFPEIGVQVWKMSTTDTESAVQTFADDPRIEYMEPNYIISLERTPNDPSFSKLWGLHNSGQSRGKADADIDAPEAWEKKTGGDIIVAVIDTGVDYKHPDLASNMWINKGEIPNNRIDDDKNGYIDDVYGYDFVNKDGDPFDDHYHGTHVAGTIAASGNNNKGVVGVSWTAKIMAIKFLSKRGSGSISGAIAAIRYATKMGAKISNNSWGGGGRSQALHDAIKQAEKAGQLFVAAAGNYAKNNDTKPHYPSSYKLDNIIAVAATDHNDQLARFSHYGRTSVDLGAPGVNIYSTIPRSGYKYLNGTSMATPQVSGALSLLLATCPQLTATQAKKIILDSVDKVSALSGKTVTGGRLNVHNALKACHVEDTPNPKPPTSKLPQGCKHATYFAEKRLLEIPYINLPLLDPITGRALGKRAVFKGSLDLVEGVKNFKVIPNSVEFVGMLGNQKCLATYSYATRTLFIPFVDVPSVMVIPPNVTVPGPVQVFEVRLQQLPLSDEIFDLKHYRYLDTIQP
jgi:subtilisin family serine protease